MYEGATGFELMMKTKIDLDFHSFKTEAQEKIDYYG